MERCEQPECFEPEKNNGYPLCIGKDKAECEEYQLRADWEPEDPYAVEYRHSGNRILTLEENKRKYDYDKEATEARNLLVQAARRIIRLKG